MNDDAFDAEMAALREEFQLATVERMADLRRAMEAFSEATTSAARQAALEQLEAVAHKLGGSGALFGFSALGDAAQAFELACQNLQADPNGDAGPVRQTWDALEKAAQPDD